MFNGWSRTAGRHPGPFGVDNGVVSDSAPLTTRLAWTWTALTIEVDNLFESVSAEHVGRHFRIATAMWANGLRLIGQGGITVDDLRTRAHARCNLGGLERWGWISIGEPDTRRRPGYGTHRGIDGRTVVHLTRAGQYAQRWWPRAVVEVEQRWRDRFGAGNIDALIDVLGARAPAMPWSVPEVAPSDGFHSRVFDGGTVEPQDPPLAAQLGQALTAATLEFECDASVSLPLAANFLRVIGSDPVRLRDLPALTGISKEGSAMATGYLQRRGLAVAMPERSIVLTADGLDVRAAYLRWASRSQQPDLHEALVAVLAQSEALSAGLVPPQGVWRGEKPYLAQTQRALADPTGALPWHPMVLHRGGWPDGS